MNDQTRSEVLRRWYGGQSMRRIARDLHLSRKTVSQVIAEHQHQRTTGTTGLPAPRQTRGSLVDPYETALREYLARYPDISVVRLLEEMRRRVPRRSTNNSCLRNPTTMTTPKKKTTPAKKKATAPSTNLRERVLDDAKTLKLPLSAEMLDDALARAEQEGLSHLSFLQLILGEPAVRSRQRAVERRIREARFREEKTLAQFDWKFNASAIDRAQIEQLATGEFVRRGENLVMMGQSGVGKSHLLQSLSRRFCELGYRVRYTTSADLLEDLRKSLADESLPRRVRYWSRFDLIVIDEFGFDRIERGECPQAANLFYKVIDARSGQRSTALATNIDFEAWSEYLGDPPLAMAFLDRVVDGAILLKIRGKSYRAHRAKRPPGRSKHDTT